MWQEGLYRPDLDAGPYERQGYELDVLVPNSRAEEYGVGRDVGQLSLFALRREAGVGQVGEDPCSAAGVIFSSICCFSFKAASAVANLPSRAVSSARFVSICA